MISVPNTHSGCNAPRSEGVCIFCTNNLKQTIHSFILTEDFICKVPWILVRYVPYIELVVDVLDKSVMGKAHTIVVWGLK